MTDSNWEALAEISLRQIDPELEDRNYTFCLCSRVLVKNQTEAVAIEQEELSEAYDIFTEQYCDNHVATMNRPKDHSQEEEDSDANSCYFSASASHTDNYCTTDEHERDSGADISEYHGVASTSRELFMRSHRESCSTSVERDQTNSLTEVNEEKEINEQWDKYWSENCERLIWTSWIENYSDFISPEYQNDHDHENKSNILMQTNESNQIDENNSININSIEKRDTEIIVSTCSEEVTETKREINEMYDDATRSDLNLRDMMDNLALPRCDSASSSIPMTIKTDSMTNVTQITLSSYGFCSSRVTSSENSQLSESTPSSLSPPFQFDEEDATKNEQMNEDDTVDQQWQLLWQQHYQEQYNQHYTNFIGERKHYTTKVCSISKDTKSIASEPLNTDDDEHEFTELKQLAELGLPTSFGSKYHKGHLKHTTQRQTDELQTDRVKAAFTLMGFSFQNLHTPDTNGHVMYRKRNIRLHNNLLKMKKKRIDLDSSARDEALLNLMDSSSDEADKPLPTITMVKLDATEQNAQRTESNNVLECVDVGVDESSNNVENMSSVHASKDTELRTEIPIEILTQTPTQISTETPAKNCDINDELVTSTIIDDNASGAIPKSISKKSKKKRRQNKLLAGLPAEIANDRTLYKYWCKRFSLFSLFDSGIKLDRESWFSVTPEKVAIYTAMRCTCDIIIDAFCGVGGNTIQFAKTCQRVIAIDIDAKKIEMAKHNACIYGVADRIEFIVGDYFKLASSLKADVVFLSPPWGGPQYLKDDVYDIEKSLLPMPASKLMAYTRQITPNIAIYLPRNTNTFQLAKLAGPGNSVEVEQGFLDRKLIAITAFYGNLMKKTQT